MTMNMLKPRQLCLLALLSVAAVGCTGEAGEEGEEGRENGDTPSQPEISMMLVQNIAEPPLPTIVPELQERTGTKLTFTWVPENIYTDKMISAIAAGTLPKVVQVKAVDLKHPSVVNSIRAGSFWEIGPYLERYPYISKYMNPEIMKNGSFFGNDYGLYWERPLSRQGVQYRKDWLDRLGLKEPRTLDELYMVMRAFTYEDPDGNGKQDTYGMVDRNDLVFGSFKNLATYFGAPNGWGLSDGRLVPDFMTPEYMDTMRFVKKLYDEHMINADFTVTSKVQQEERFIKGEAGMMISNLLAASIQERMRKVNPDGEIDIQNRIRGPQGDRVWGGTGFGGLFLFPKSSIKTEAELQEVLGFFDKTLSEDVNNLISYGMKGRHYSLLINGTVKIMPDTKSIREREVEPYANALRTADIRYLQLSETNAVQDKINRMVEDNKSISVPDLSAPLVSPTQAERGAELQTIISDATYRFILGQLSEAEFAQELERWKKSGGSAIIEELNHEYAEFNH